MSIVSRIPRPPRGAADPVRWDAAASDRSFWTPPPAAPRPDEAAPAPATAVRVHLFGALAAAGLPQPLMLRLAPRATVASLLVALGGALGPERFADVADGQGNKRRTCRVFVDGHAVDEADAPIVGRDGGADIEIILLTGIEGG